jgi:hypothetical protein
MSDVRQRSSSASSAADQQARYGETQEPTGWVGMVLFGAILMIMMGVFQAIEGFVALFHNSYYLVKPAGLVVNVNYTTWGWTHLIIGLVALGAGFGLMTGATWARVLGIAVALVSAILNFVFIAAFPFWSITMITIDILIIYAIAAHGRELRES